MGVFGSGWGGGGRRESAECGRVQGFRVLRFRVQGLGCSVSGLRFRVEVCGLFRALEFWVKIWGFPKMGIPFFALPFRGTRIKDLQSLTKPYCKSPHNSSKPEPPKPLKEHEEQAGSVPSDSVPPGEASRCTAPRFWGFRVYSFGFGV